MWKSSCDVSVVVPIGFDISSPPDGCSTGVYLFQSYILDRPLTCPCSLFADSLSPFPVVELARNNDGDDDEGCSCWRCCCVAGCGRPFRSCAFMQAGSRGETSRFQRIEEKLPSFPLHAFLVPLHRSTSCFLSAAGSPTSHAFDTHHPRLQDSGPSWEPPWLRKQLQRCGSCALRIATRFNASGHWHMQNLQRDTRLYRAARLGTRRTVGRSQMTMRCTQGRRRCPVSSHAMENQRHGARADRAAV